MGETVAGIAKDAGVDLKDKATQTQDSLTSSVSEASDTLGEVRDSIGDMNAAIDKTSGAIASADAALAGLQGQAPSLTQAISQGNDLLGEARATAGNSITSLSKALSEGSLALTKTSASANAAIGKLTGTVTSTTTRIDNSLESLQATIDHNKAVIGHLEILVNDTSTGSEEIDARIVSTIDLLREQNEKLQSIKDGLSAQSSAMANDAAAVSGASDAINNAIQTGATNLGQAQTNLGQNALPKASSALDSFAAVSGDLTGIVSGLTPTITNARGTLAQLDATLKQAKTTLSQTDALLAKVQDKLATAANDIAALQTSESMGELADLMGVDVDDVADFMASPVELASKSIYPVKSFGSGIAPFYTNLALWVGGYVLIAIYKLEVDREGIGSFTARQGYFGRWLLLVILGALQAIIVTVGDLVIGVQCVSPLLFVLGGIAISFTYVNIIYALSTTFKHIGKAIGVILVIVQIPGSSGMYPIEMMPGFFQWLHPLLPFTYGINLLRETVGGMYSFNYLFNLCILGVFLAIALFIGLQLRPHLLFDKQLSTTGLMICESNDLPRQRYSLRTAMRVMLDSDSYRRELLDHAVAFEHRYPYYIKGGFAAVVGVQVLLFVLSTVLDIDNNGKIILLVIWIISVIAICGWLINIEYIRASLNTQMRISALSDEDLRREMREHTAAIPAARRMFGLNASERGAKGGEQPTSRLSHIGAHRKAQDADGADNVTGNDGDTTSLGKHSKGGEA